MERVEFGRWTSKVKTIGATLCVGGALTTSLYKGNEFYIGLSTHHSHTPTLESSKPNMLRGTLFLLGSCFSYTAWFIVQVFIHSLFFIFVTFSFSKNSTILDIFHSKQVKLLQIFPFKYWGTMLTCIIASVQAAIVGICLDCRKVTWSLKWNLQLITIIYSVTLLLYTSYTPISYINY